MHGLIRLFLFVFVCRTLSKLSRSPSPSFFPFFFILYPILFAWLVLYHCFKDESAPFFSLSLLFFFVLFSVLFLALSEGVIQILCPDLIKKFFFCHTKSSINDHGKGRQRERRKKNITKKT